MSGNSDGGLDMNTVLGGGLDMNTVLGVDTAPGDMADWYNGYTDTSSTSYDPRTDFSGNVNPTDLRLWDGTQATPGGTDSTPGSLDWLKRYFSADGSPNLLTMAKDGISLAAAIDAFQRAKNPPTTGYQGGIPSLTAVRAQTAPPVASARPGAGGHRYFSDTMYANNAITGAGAGGLSAIKTAVADQGAVLDSRNAARVAQQPTALTPEQQQAAADRFYGRTPQHFAAGGKPRYLRGHTDGMADKIHTTIDGKQPAALAHGEFVIPADVVSHLGNGNSDAGADVLYKMMDRIRKARTGTKKQGKRINPDKFTPGGLAFAAGGAVQHFVDGGTPSGAVGTESNLSNWVGPYVTDMLAKGQALSTLPYQAYGGPLTAGDSALQAQAFGNASNLAVPTSIGEAADTAGATGASMGALDYTPAGIAAKNITAPSLLNFQMQAPANVLGATTTAAQTGYTPLAQAAQTGATPLVQAAQTGAAPLAQAAQTNYGQNIQAAQAGPAQQVTSQNFGTQSAQDYMSPYMQSVVDAQQREAQRAADIATTGRHSDQVKQGAFGGSRGAIMDAEAARNLALQKGDIQAKGLQDAYAQAQAQFNADQARSLTAQQSNQGAGVTVGGQNLAAQQTAQGLNSQVGAQMALANLGNQQQSNLANQALQGQYGLANLGTQQQANLSNQALQGQYGLANLGTQQATNLANQGVQAQYGLANLGAQQAANLQNAGFTQQANLANQAAGLTTAQQNLGANLGVQSLGAGQALQAGLANQSADLAAQQANQQAGQFGANYGLQALQGQLQAANTQGNLGVAQNQAGIAALNAQLGAGQVQQANTQAGITADQAAFNAERDNPYKMVQYQQSLLQGLPLAAQSYNISTNPFYAAAGAGADVAKTLGVTP